MKGDKLEMFFRSGLHQKKRLSSFAEPQEQRMVPAVLQSNMTQLFHLGLISLDQKTGEKSRFTTSVPRHPHALQKQEEGKEGQFDKLLSANFPPN